MVVEINLRYSLKEIENFVERSLEGFVREHADELIEALDRDDYDEVPNIPFYWTYYDGELVPQIKDRMQQSGYDNRQIEEMITNGNALFWRSILPTARSYQREKYAGVK